MTRSASLFVLFAAGFTVVHFVSAQDYPTKPIRIITGSVGGGTDFTSRILAQELSGPLGQPIVVENRPGGTIGSETVAKSQPDGYTLLLTANLHWISPLFGKSPYDPLKDFSPISMVSSSPNVLVVHPTVPAKSMRELIAVAKAHPGVLNYGSTGPGSGSHLAGELLKYMARIDMVHIPYKGTGVGLTALMGGHIQLMFASASSVASNVKAGKLRALAVSSIQPTPLAPGLPTIASAGLPGYESVQIYAFFAPARTSAAIINRLNQEVVRAVARPEVKEKFFNSGADPAGTTPERLAAVVSSESERLRKVVKAAGIKLIE